MTDGVDLNTPALDEENQQSMDIDDQGPFEAPVSASNTGPSVYTGFETVHMLSSEDSGTCSSPGTCSSSISASLCGPSNPTT